MQIGKAGGRVLRHTLVRSGLAAKRLVTPISTAPRASALAALIVGLWLLHPLSGIGQMMTLPGKFDVGPTGAANYSIPISTPPGTGGVVPTLTLEYSSQAGDGMVGIGWSLGGLPAVARCPQSIAQDGVHGRVTFDANDRFCLSGQRLIVISGTYGADGAEYRTEIEGFSRVISHGAVGGGGSGPTWFEVHTKSGQAMEFGHTTDSQILVQGTTTVRTWAINKVSDTKGNYYTVAYSADAANGQAYPAEIDYTGNATAGVTAYNAVKFTYNTARPDVAPLYQAGVLLQTTRLLTNVQTYKSTAVFDNTTLVSNYALTYQLGSSTAHSRLTGVQLCGADGNCLPATTFTWQGSRDQLGITSAASTLPNALAWNGVGATYLTGDFNGDGLTDVFLLQGSPSCPASGSLFLGTQTPGTFAAANDHFCNQTDAHGPGYIYLGDFNADGHTDFIDQTSYQQNCVDEGGYAGNIIVCTPISGTGNLNLYLSYTQGTFSGTGGITGCGNNNGCGTISVGDFNGDGKADLIIQKPATTSTCAQNSNYGCIVWNYAPGSAVVYLGDGQGHFTQSGSIANAGASTPTFTPQLIVADFDGDGCADVLVHAGGTAIAEQIFLSDCNGGFRGTISLPTSWNGTNIQLVVGDFNGDGKVDVLVLYPGGSTAGSLWLSTGSAMVQQTFSVPVAWNNYNVVSGDWNGDGKADIALIAKGSSQTQHQLFLSTGTGFVQSSTTIANNLSTPQPTVADWNNDGASDILIRTQTGTGDIQYNFNYIPEMVSVITTGLGATTTISYDRLNRSTIYTKDSTATYPTVDLQGPSYVVSRIDASNGIGGTYSSNYGYVGAKADLSGRGFLGFRQAKVTDLQTNVVQTTTYRQDVPFVGLVSSQTKVLGSQTLNTINNTYSCVNETAGNNNCTPAAGIRYFVALSQSVSSSADLDGTAMPTTTSTYQYDAYGNATQVTASTGDGYSTTTTNTYTNDTTNWFLGRLTRATVTSVTP